MSIRQHDLVVGTALVLYIVFFALSPPAPIRTVLSHPIGVAASFGAAIYTTLYYSKPIGGLLIVALLASMTGVTEGFDTYTGTFNEQTYLAANPDIKANVESGKGFASGRAHWDAAGKNEGRPGSGLTKVTARSYQTYANTDYTGQGDLKMVTGDVEKCKAECDGTPACTGFARLGNSCYLKNSSVRTPMYTTAVTHYYTGSPPPGPATPAGAPAATTPPVTTPTAPAASTPAAAMPPTPTTATPPAPAPKPVMACNIENFAPF